MFKSKNYIKQLCRQIECAHWGIITNCIKKGKSKLKILPVISI